MVLCGLQVLAALVDLRLQLRHALAPPLHALCGKPAWQLLLQRLQMRQLLALLLLARGQIAQRQQRDELCVGQFQVGMDGGQLAKAVHHFLCVVEG